MKIAIITGASSGLGKDYVFNADTLSLDEIWGISLPNENLKETFKNLKTKFVPIEMDLTNIESFNLINEKLMQEKPEVELLVNCSGFGKFGRYNDIKTDSMLNMIDLNCKAMVHLTQLILPYMPNNARICNFGSIAGFQPVPYVNVYAATKAFVISYSRALNEELKHRNISVTCVCPFWTKTQFFKRAVNTDNKVIKKYVVMYDSKKVALKAFKDTIKRKQFSVYGFIANMQRFLSKILPHKLIILIWCKQQNFKKTYKNN